MNKPERHNGGTNPRSGAAYVSPRAHVVRCVHLGEPIFFTVDNPDDVIQSEHMQGRFYEPEELEIISSVFPIGGRFLDIGANVGNHSLYLAKYLRAQRIVVIEPNPLAIPLLTANIRLNGIEDVCDMGHLGLGLSDGQSDMAFMRTGKNNLGGARVKEGLGDIPLQTGDALFADEVFDLVKIDVEGMEMKVLDGMNGFITAHAPRMFIEVDKKNYDAFDAWVAQKGYRVRERFQRYPSNTNFLIEAQV